MRKAYKKYLSVVSLISFSILSFENIASAESPRRYSLSTCQNAHSTYQRTRNSTNTQEALLALQTLNLVNDCMINYVELVSVDRSYCEEALGYASLVAPIQGTSAIGIRFKCSQSTEPPASPQRSPERQNRPEPHRGLLDEGESQWLRGQFYEGERIYATCDADCDDLDLKLYDSDDSLVDSDTLDDDEPIVTAPYEGTFTIEVIMHSCTHQSGCETSVDSKYGF